MHTETRDSNLLNNVWNNLTEGDGEWCADLNNFGNEWTPERVRLKSEGAVHK